MQQRTSFFTSIDPNAAIKGSVDPLGAQVIWIAAGRQLIHNLTTVSTLLRDFTICLTGLHLADWIRHKSNEPIAISDAFLRWEQLCAYSRYSHSGDQGFRGIEQVKRRLDGTRKVTISAQRDWQILGNQKVYGIWGLYRSPLRSSGLVDGVNNDSLTRESAEMVQRLYLPKLWPDQQTQRELERFLLSDGRQLSIDSTLSKTIASILRPKALAVERSFYASNIVRGGSEDVDLTHGRQSSFVDLIAKNEEILVTYGPHALDRLARRAEKDPQHRHLAQSIHDLVTVERVLGPLTLLFLYLQSQDRVSLSAVAGNLSREWGPRANVNQAAFIAALNRVGVNDQAIEQRWSTLAGLLHAGEYDTLVEKVIELNQFVMSTRRSVGAWIEIVNKKMSVKLASEQGSLEGIKGLEVNPRYTYFVPTLHRLMNDVGVG